MIDTGADINVSGSDILPFVQAKDKKKPVRQPFGGCKMVRGTVKISTFITDIENKIQVIHIEGLIDTTLKNSIWSTKQVIITENENILYINDSKIPIKFINKRPFIHTFVVINNVDEFDTIPNTRRLGTTADVKDISEAVKQ